MATVSIQRTRDDLARLTRRGLGVGELSRAAARILGRAVVFDGVCVMTMDPATLLPTGHTIENGLPDEVTPRLAEIELLEPDFNAITDLARRSTPAASLAAARGGDLRRSARQRELRGPHGFGDELRSALVTDGEAWGGLVLMRAAGRPHFTPADVRLVASVSGVLADGLRRAILRAAPREEDEPDAEAGLLLLTDGGSIETANDAARRWLAEMGPDDAPSGRVPFVVRTVAAHAGHGRDAASARVRTRAGRWLSVRGSVLGAGAKRRTAGRRLARTAGSRRARGRRERRRVGRRPPTDSGKAAPALSGA